MLRLAPLFVFFVALLWIIALTTSGGHLRVSVPRAVLDTRQWLTFTIAGMPDLNRAPTSIMGGPAWSLPYEWWFYFSLPLAALLTGCRPSRVLAGARCGGHAGRRVVDLGRAGWPIAGGVSRRHRVRLRGAAAAHLRRRAPSGRGRGLPRRAGGRDPIRDRIRAVAALLLSSAFAIIACGNTLFGALEWPAARGLGDIGYSIYLLHGLAAVRYVRDGPEPAEGPALSMAGPLAGGRRVRADPDGGELRDVPPDRSTGDGIGRSRQPDV